MHTHAHNPRALPLLGNDLVDVVDDVVELLVTLALAMAHGELRVDELPADRHLEGTGFAGFVDLRLEVDFGAKLVGEEGGESGSEAFVASAASEADVDIVLARVTVGVVDLLMAVRVAVTTAAAAVIVLLGAAVAAAAMAVLVTVLVGVGRHDTCWLAAVSLLAGAAPT
jgi:hypothetical protein